MIIHFDNVPYYSQFQDIPRIEWRKEGCGIASMAMSMEFYKPKSVSITKLLMQALEFGAYTPGVGWKHKELAALAELYGLTGKNYDFAKLGNQAAFDLFKKHLAEGPVIVSIHNKFDPRATMGHIIVVTGMEDGLIYYHDPAYGTKTERKISEKGFLSGWKRRFITVREKTDNALSLSTELFSAEPPIGGVINKL